MTRIETVEDLSELFTETDQLREAIERIGLSLTDVLDDALAEHNRNSISGERYIIGDEHKLREQLTAMYYQMLAEDAEYGDDED